MDYLGDDLECVRRHVAQLAGDRQHQTGPDRERQRQDRRHQSQFQHVSMPEQLRSMKDTSAWVGSRHAWYEFRGQGCRACGQVSGEPRGNTAVTVHRRIEHVPFRNANSGLVELVAPAWMLESIVIKNAFSFVCSVLPLGAPAPHAGRSSELVGSLPGLCTNDLHRTGSLFVKPSQRQTDRRTDGLTQIDTQT